MTIATERRYTIEEFIRLPLDGVWELVDGEPVEKKMGNYANQIALQVASQLLEQLQKKRRGTVVAECWMRVASGVLRRPDVAFIGVDLAPIGPLPDVLDFAPTLAVEVVSPGNTVDEIEDKIREYFATGVPLVWIVLPKQRALRMHGADGSVRQFEAADTVSDEPLLPGLTFKVAELFALPGQTA